MEQLQGEHFLIGHDDLILVTGATGFIGSKLVENLLNRGFRNLRCLVRSSNAMSKLERVLDSCRGTAHVEVMKGNLLSREDCGTATKDVAVLFHLAAARGEKSFPEAFLNSVVTTRNLLDATVRQESLKRFVNVSSFTVYADLNRPKLLDESCPLEVSPELRGDAYDFAKARQDEIVTDYARRFGIPCVTVRPGYVFGPGNEGITGRVGIGTFGVFLHLGGSNTIPFTFVDNCADAIALAGLKLGVDGEVFNVVDDDLPSSREFLNLYKRNVRKFTSLYIPHTVSYALCYLWEKYSTWSQGQLPQAFNRKKWHAYWRKTTYSNEKLKSRLGWTPQVSMAEGLRRHFDSCRYVKRHA
jgi:nucleoside-diphosphate-sugar epimerase